MEKHPQPIPILKPKMGMVVHEGALCVKKPAYNCDEMGKRSARLAQDGNTYVHKQANKKALAILDWMVGPQSSRMGAWNLSYEHPYERPHNRLLFV